MRPAGVRHLREIRLELGRSLGDLSRDAGVAKPTLSLIERGRAVATTDQAIAIAEALELEPGSLSIRTLLVLEVKT